MTIKIIVNVYGENVREVVHEIDVVDGEFKENEPEEEYNDALMTVELVERAEKIIQNGWGHEADQWLKDYKLWFDRRF
jgi:hypothetical protein